MTAIAARFGIDHDPYLEWIDSIRRGENTSIAWTGSMPLYAGDTINLDPYTIATVGCTRRGPDALGTAREQPRRGRR